MTLQEVFWLFIALPIVVVGGIYWVLAMGKMIGFIAERHAEVKRDLDSWEKFR